MAKYIIWNETDGIPAHWDEFDTEQEAQEQVEKLRDRYRKQGHYTTNRWERIAPEDIWYEVRQVDVDEDE